MCLHPIRYLEIYRMRLYSLAITWNKKDFTENRTPQKKKRKEGKYSIFDKDAD